MLPFTKRSARGEENTDVNNSGDVEVVRPAKERISAAPSSSRKPLIISEPDEDDMTTVMPRKDQLAALAARVPVPPSPSSRRVFNEDPTRHYVRSNFPPPALGGSEEPAEEQAVPSTAVNIRDLVKGALKKEPAAAAAAAPAVNARPVDADRKSDPPATVITTRTRIIAQRPTVQWAAALVAMGVFVGLVTAVIARGDADSLIDATASAVDPAARAAGGNAAAAGLQTKFASPLHALAPSPDTFTPPKEEPKAVDLVDLPAANPTPARPAPVVFARRARPAARPAAARERDEKVLATKAAPAKTAKKSSADEDVESASAADALAKAQLEASLK